MKTKQLFKNLAILLFFSIGFFSIYSFTSVNSNTEVLTSFDQSYYQDMDSNNLLFNFSDTTTDNDKCGGDKNDKDSKDAKETKDSKCGDGKCGDDKKEAKKSAEDKDTKCGTGKCG